jgi:hypothetical protein
MKTEIVNTPGGTVFAGRPAVDLFRAIALRSGIAMYSRTGMKPNSAWTPTAMLRTAGQITGKTYKRGQYQQAFDDLEAWIVEAKRAIPVRHD